MIISTQKISLLLPIIFVIHNIEEYLSYARLADYYFKFIDPKLKDPKVFLYAVSILSIVVVLIVGVSYFYCNKITKFLTMIVFFSIFINAIQHCINSLFFRKILPETITSILLIIPYSIIFIINMKNGSIFEFKDFLLYGILSVIVMKISILLSLKISYWLIKAIKHN